jgi:hypothetical protein
MHSSVMPFAIFGLLSANTVTGLAYPNNVVRRDEPSPTVDALLQTPSILVYHDINGKIVHERV